MIAPLLGTSLRPKRRKGEADVRLANLWASDLPFSFALRFLRPKIDSLPGPGGWISFQFLGFILYFIRDPN